MKNLAQVESANQAMTVKELEGLDHRLNDASLMEMQVGKRR
ncbi:MAG: hypothetical protein WD688_07620 [Candidatus Binatia bacterium]